MSGFISRRLERLRRREDGYAMIMALFLILIVSTATLAAAGVYLSQLSPTRLAKKRVETVDSANAGMQAISAVFNNTPKNANGYADLTKLPCSDISDGQGISAVVGSNSATVQLPGYQIQGSNAQSVNPGSTSTYRAVIAYFSADPTSQEQVPVTNVSNNWWTQHALTCKSNLVSAVPAFAYIESFGADNQATGLSTTEGDRTLHAIYQFNSVNAQNVTSGGRLAEFNSSAQDSMCLDAGTGTVAAGTLLYMEPCQVVGYAPQSWLYRSDLTIQYGGNTTSNLCIQNVTQTEGQAGTAELEPCITAGDTSVQTYPYASATQQEQEWAYNDNGQIESPNTSNGSVGSGPCLEGQNVTTSTAAVAGAQLVVETCSGSSGDLTAWKPDPTVGAGKSFSCAASAGCTGVGDGVPSASPTNQFVNYELFGNCLDVNGQNFNNDLIAYPCKQAPDATTLTWNQIWHFQTVSGNYGIFYTNCAAGAGGCLPSSPSAATPDCLVSPSAENGLVSGIQCPTNGTYTDSELWKASGDQANDYTDSYELVNKSSGYCMAPDPGKTSAGFDQIVVTNCDGADLTTASGTAEPSSVGQLLEKWNAPANSSASGINGVGEDNGGTTSAGQGGS